MSRGTWTVYREVSTSAGGSAWTLDSTIYKPNSDLNFPQSSTKTIVSNSDGEKVYFNPSTKFLNDQITIPWRWVDDTFLAQITTYQENGYKLKIVTHVVGRDFIGYIMQIDPRWFSGVDGDYYDIDVVFERSE